MQKIIIILVILFIKNNYIVNFIFGTVSQKIQLISVIFYFNVFISNVIKVKLTLILFYFNSFDNNRLNGSVACSLNF
jgi:hypothetical protein